MEARDTLQQRKPETISSGGNQGHSPVEEVRETLQGGNKGQSLAKKAKDTLQPRHLRTLSSRGSQGYHEMEEASKLVTLYSIRHH